MNFMYFIRLLTLLFIKLDFVIDDVNSNISYGLTKITSSFSTYFFFDSILCSSFLYNFCISQILFSTYWFSYPLYILSLLASILWIWNTQSSMLLWIKYHKSSNISRILVAFIVWLLMLTFRIVSSISVIIILVSPTIFIISHTCL